MAARTYHDWLARALLPPALLLTMASGPRAAGPGPEAAAGAILVAEALRLPHGADWQRGDPREEEEQDGYLLGPRAGAAPGPELFVPRRGTPLSTDEARFREQLAIKWRAQFGRQADIGAETLAGRAWTTCRRPGRDGVSTVFQWVTVEAGRAYHLVWFVPGRARDLPDAARTLMAGIAFGDAPADAAPPTPAAPPVTVAEAAPAPPPGPMAVAALPPLTPAPAGEAPTPPAQAAISAPPTPPPRPAEPAYIPVDPPWRLTHSLVAQPGLKTLETLAQLDGRRLDPRGAVTGYGLRASESQMEWFLEGFRWSPGGPTGGERKLPFRVGWRVDWLAPPAVLDGRPRQDLSLRFTPAGEEAAGPFRVRLEWLELCAPASERRAAYAALTRGRLAPLERLLKARHRACPDAQAQALPRPLVVEVGEAGGPAEQVIELPLPRPARLPLASRQVQRVLALAVRFGVSGESDGALGNELLRQSGVWFLYAPEGSAGRDAAR